MSAVKSVLLAIDVATAKRDQAGKSLRRAQQTYLFAQSQMSQLSVYATETESRWIASAQTSTTPELMRHHYQFMDRLNHAIGLQQGVLEDASRKVEVEKQLVLMAEFRVTSLKLVLKKKQAAIAILQARREQKQMDEFATMRPRQTGGSDMGGYFSGDRS